MRLCVASLVNVSQPIELCVRVVFPPNENLSLRVRARVLLLGHAFGRGWPAGSNVVRQNPARNHRRVRLTPDATVPFRAAGRGGGLLTCTCAGPA